ncbi:MAG: PAS domain S-box protein [Bacteroidota bacterium]
MAEFKNISIKNKLILIQLATAFMAAMICSSFFLYNDIKTFKSSEVRNKKSIAEIVGVNLIPPLLFYDQDAANKICLHLDDNPSILNAVVLEKNGKEFAGYIKKGEAPFSFPKPGEKPLVKQRFWESKFIVSYQIFQEKEFLGTIMLRAELTDLRIIIFNYFKTAILILIFSIFSTFIISNFLQRIITNRLLSLVRSTKEVAKTGNYSLRISAQGKDEIGVLSEGFNSMLEQIEKTAMKLELSLSLMRATIESTADGILVVDKERKISVLNTQFKKLWKIPDEILKTGDDNKTLAYVITQIKYPEKFLNKVNELYANPELESYDVFEMKDGTIFERYSIPQRTQRGEIIGRVWSFRDVTIRNRAVEELHKLNEQLEVRVKERTADLTKTQESLQLSEEKYRKLVEEAGDVVYTSDYKGYFTYINPMSKKITGYTENEMIGKLFLEIIDPEWKERVAKFYKEQFDNKIQETLFSFPIITKSGEKKWVEQTVIQQKVGDRIVGHQAIVRDITQRIKIEEEIKQKSEELARSNQELEQFAYVASHDLQEPLRTIYNFVGLLDKKYSGKTDEDSKEYFKFIVNATSKMQNLIKDLLEFSRVGKNMLFTAVDCNKILKEVIADLDTSIKESNAKITSAILPVLQGNETELKRLFQNLISNAIKFRKKNVSPEITITVEQKKKEYLFAIRDNGIGIEEKFISKLFIIFQRLHSVEEYPGTGIGLATCKKIVTLHRGKIWVESKLGEGSSFYFTLSKEKLNLI